MRCEQAQEHLSAYLDGELSSALASAVRAHVASCPDCRQTLEELRATAALLGRLPVRAAPQGLSDDILREIERRMLAPAPAADTPTPERTLAVHRVRRWPRILAIAACGALAAGIGIMTYLGTMIPERPPETIAGAGALSLRAGRHPDKAFNATDTSRTLAGDSYDDRSVESATLMGQNAATPGEIAMKQAPGPRPAEKAPLTSAIPGGAQTPMPPADLAQANPMQGQAPTRGARGRPAGRKLTALKRGSKTAQEGRLLEAHDETALAGTLGGGHSAVAAKAGGEAGGAAPTNAPQTIQMVMNKVALGQAPVEALRQTATPETLRQSPNQLVVRARSREAANAELIRLFTLNGWAEMSRPAAANRLEDEDEKDRQSANGAVAETLATSRFAANTPAAPQVPTDQPAGWAPARLEETGAAQPPTTPGIFYRAHSDGEDMWVVVASADDLPRFAAQVAQSRTMIVEADSTQPFQAVRSLQQELATFEVKAKRQGLRDSTATLARKAEENAADQQHEHKATPKVHGTARALPANIQAVQRLPENQIMLVVRVQGPPAGPPGARAPSAERTETESAETAPEPTETARPDSAPESPRDDSP